MSSNRVLLRESSNYRKYKREASFCDGSGGVFSRRHETEAIGELLTIKQTCTWSNRGCQGDTLDLAPGMILSPRQKICSREERVLRHLQSKSANDLECNHAIKRFLVTELEKGLVWSALSVALLLPPSQVSSKFCLQTHHKKRPLAYTFDSYCSHENEQRKRRG